MGFPKKVHGCELESFNTYSTEITPVGTKMMAEDGRLYRFCENGAAALKVGTLCQSPIWDKAKWGDQAIADTLVAGDTVMTGIGATTTSIAASLLKHGYFFVDSAADTNPAYSIKDNALITQGAATGTITLHNKLVAAIAAASQCSYCMSAWRDVIVTTSPLTAMAVGVAVKAIAINYFGWLQTGGACRALAGGTPLEGDIVVNDTSAVDGIVMESAAFETDGPAIGITQCDQADTEFMLVHLTLDKN